MGNKRITLKGITVLLLIALMAALLPGCTFGKTDTQQMLVAYMNNRYPDENFTVHNTDWVSYDTEYYITTVYFDNDEYKEGEIHAYIAYDKGLWIYRDNFILLKNQDAIEAEMGALAQEYFGPCKVYANYVTRDILQDIKPDAGPGYIYKNCDVELVIYLPPQEIDYKKYNDATEAFYDKLLEDGRERIFGTVWVISSQDVYDKTDAIFDTFEMTEYEDVSKKVAGFGVPVFYPQN